MKEIALNLIKGFAVVLITVVCGTQLAFLQDIQGEWKQARPGRMLEFPRDHASHPDYRIEWWYYTGNLEAVDGHRFGYQVTFFRVGIDREPENPSRWTVRDLFISHIALTDVDGGEHLVAERLNRAGVGWAGARTDRLEVWNEDWRLEVDGEAHVLRVASDDGRFALDLRLEADTKPVVHGQDGFSQKGAQSGNASHYYSLTRMKTTGQVQLLGKTVHVNGLSWMDHEFGTSFLEPSQQGWDWFSLQLTDGTDIMMYAVRQENATLDPRSSGTIVTPTRIVTSLLPDEFRLIPGRLWVSPISGGRYPVEWRVEIPGEHLSLDVRAAVDQQELHTQQSTGITYWEGAVVVAGTRDGQVVEGRGYLEMTGYVGRPISEVLR